MKITLLLVAIIFVVFMFQINNPSLTEQYAFSGKHLVSQPAVAVTSIFLHAGLLHLLSNVLALLFFGSAVESELGGAKMMGLFFAGAFAGEAASLLIYPWGALAVGASGAIFALVGTGMIIRPFDISFYPLIIPLPLAFIGALYIIYNIIGFYSGPSNISYIAHFGGLLVGILMGLKQEGGKKGLLIVALMMLIILLLPMIISGLI